MNKQEFLTQMQKALSWLPQEDIEERIAFYSEIIDDHIEEGMSEEQAIAEIGSVQEVTTQIVAETPLPRLVKEKVKPKRALRIWEIILIVLGFPVWFPLIIAAGAVILSLYIVVWALVISLWAFDISILISALGGIAISIVYFINANITPAFMTLAIAMFIGGLSIFILFGCVAVSKSIIKLTWKGVIGIKYMFINKETRK